MFFVQVWFALTLEGTGVQWGSWSWSQWGAVFCCGAQDLSGAICLLFHHVLVSWKCGYVAGGSVDNECLSNKKRVNPVLNVHLKKINKVMNYEKKKEKQCIMNV